MSDREKLLNLTREATAKIANHCANTSCEKCAKESGKYDKESGKCKCSTMEMFTDHLIANGVTVQQWIPVSERLPDKKGKYLALLEYVKCTMILNFSLDFLVCDEYGFPTKEKKSCFYYYDDDWENIEVPEVTHWMPIPEPPKGAQE